MTSQLVLLSALVVVGCLAQDPSKNARILFYDFENTGTGPYQFSFETSDGTKREEQGTLINANTEDEALVMRGSYSYTGQDGKVYTVRYVADENGFHPEGDHIKVPPFVPWVHGHHHHHESDNNVQQDFNSPTTKEYLPSTPSPLSPVRVPINLQPQEFVPIGTSTVRPAVTNAYIPSTPSPLIRGQLNPQIVNLLSNGNRDGLNTGEINTV